MKNINIPKILITIIISAIIMSTSGFTVYSMVAKPKFYDYFIQVGTKYLQEGRYQEAVLEFTKAISIDKKSTQGRVGAAKAYIGMDDMENAVILLQEAQDIDIGNTELLREIINILRDIDPSSAYEMLEKYIDHIGEGNIPNVIRQLLESAKESPQIPNVDPLSGIYIKPVSVRLESDKVRIGHVFYYTEDGEIPNRNSKQYRKSILVEKDTKINIIGYNPSGESTELISLEYKIDNELNILLENLINQCQNLMDNTEVGIQVGNCVEGAKEKFKMAIEQADNILEQAIVSYEVGLNSYEELNYELEKFNENIIVPTDRVQLENELFEAEQLLESAVEGSELGQYREGAKDKLQEVLDSATETFEDLLARQEDIDLVVDSLRDAVESFGAKEITEIDIIISDTGAKTGPVTVSLLWNSTDDLDLHVTSPGGDTVFYGNKSTWTGGKLDVDRQVSEFVTHPVENIYWDNPPAGEYTVKVNLYYKRSTGSVPFQVRVIIDGESKIYNMSLDSGSTTVCTFNY